MTTNLEAKARKRRSKFNQGLAVFIEWAKAEMVKDIRHALWPDCFDWREI